MNSLFGEFFRTFSGVILGVCETIWGTIRGSFWRCFGRISRETLLKNKKHTKTLFSYNLKVALIVYLTSRVYIHKVHLCILIFVFVCLQRRLTSVLARLLTRLLARFCWGKHCTVFFGSRKALYSQATDCGPSLVPARDPRVLSRFRGFP